MDVIVQTTRRLGLAKKELHMNRLGEVSGVKFSTKWEDGFGGHDQASWTMDPHDFNVTGVIVPGDRVDVWDGGAHAWTGQFVEASPTGDGRVEFHARGYAYQMGTTLCLVQTGTAPVTFATTSNPRTALSTAVDKFGVELDQIVAATGAGGWNLVPNVAFTANGETVNFNVLSELLTASLREEGNRWGMWGRTMLIAADPTSPRWRYRAGDRTLGASTIESASSVWVRWVNTAPPTLLSHYSVSWAGNYSTAQFGSRQFGFDLVDQGLMTAARAQQIADRMWAQVKRKAGIAQSLEFTPGSGLESDAGGPAMLSQVRAGHLLRVTEVRSSLAQMMPDSSVDVVIGATEWDGERLVVTPMGAAPRTLAQVIASTPDTGAFYRSQKSKVKN